MEDDVIEFLEAEKLRIYEPWSHSVIIKLFKKKLTHAYLRNKLIDIWKLQENLVLIDLGNDDFVAKFTLQESVERVLNEGPWFITGNFLTIRRWEPNCLPESHSHPQRNMGKAPAITDGIL